MSGLRESYEEELKWYTWFKERKIPVLLIINKADVADAAPLKNYLKEKTKEDALVVSALTRSRYGKCPGGNEPQSAGEFWKPFDYGGSGHRRKILCFLLCHRIFRHRKDV